MASVKVPLSATVEFAGVTVTVGAVPTSATFVREVDYMHIEIVLTVLAESLSGRYVSNA